MKKCMPVILAVCSLAAAFGAKAQEASELLLEEMTEDISEAQDAPQPENTQTVELEAAGMVFEPVTVISNDSMELTIASTDDDLSDGYTWQLNINNKTAAQMVVSLSDPAFNRVMCEPAARGGASWMVSSASEDEGEITWAAETLERAGIETVREACFTVTAYETAVNGPAVSYVSDQFTRITFGAEPASSETAPEDVSEAVSEDSGVTVTEEPQDILAELDEDGYVFRILSVTEDASGQPVWNAYVENNTDSRVMFKLADVALGGVAVDSYWDQVVYPGMKAYPQISLWTLDMENNMVSASDDATLVLQVWKAGSMPGAYRDPMEYDCEVKGTGSSAPAAGREVQETDIVLEETGDMLALIDGVNDDLDSGYFGLDIYLENRSADTLTFTIPELIVGKAEIHPSYSQILPAGSRKQTSILVDAGTLEKNGVFEVRTADLVLFAREPSGAYRAARGASIDVANRRLISAQDLELPEGGIAAAQTETAAAETAVTEAAGTEAGTEAAGTEAAGTEAGTEGEALTGETEAAETEAPGTEAPETEAAVTEAAGTEAPETEAAETEAPETEAPETETAETEAPETETAETEAPETEAAVTEAAGTEAPETEAPETEAPVTEAAETETEAVETEALETETAETEPREVTIDLPDPERLFEDTNTIRDVEAMLAKEGYDIASDGILSSGVRRVISRYREREGLPVGDQIDTTLLRSLGIVDSETFVMVQEALTAAGYDCGTPDGLTGKKTYEAVENYRKDHGLSADGFVDDALLADLGVNWACLSEEALTETETEAKTETETENETAEAVTEAEEPQTEAAEPASEEASENIDVTGSIAKAAETLASSGRADTDAYTDEANIKNLQAALAEEGYEVQMDGRLGDPTRGAIEAYRSREGLTPGIALDDEILESLGIVNAQKLKEVQEALKKAGFDCGTADGRTGKKTTAAIDAFRADRKLPAGRIDAQLLDALGLD